MTAPGSRRDRILAACGSKSGSAEDLGGEAVFKVAGHVRIVAHRGGSSSATGLAEDLGRTPHHPGYTEKRTGTIELDDSVPDEEC